MWGADDPCDRMPMVWPELTYEPQAARPAQSAASRRRGGVRRSAVRISTARRSRCGSRRPRCAAVDSSSSRRRRGPFPGLRAALTQTRRCSSASIAATRTIAWQDSARRRRIGRANLHRLRRRRQVPDRATESDAADGHRAGLRWRRAASCAARSDGPSMVRIANVVATLAGCSCSSRFSVANRRRAQPRDRRVITIWHQSRPAERRVSAATRSRASRPTIRTSDDPPALQGNRRTRSGFQAAALAGGGPELVYGPSDVLDTFHTMGCCRTCRPGFRPNVERATSSTAR